MAAAISAECGLTETKKHIRAVTRIRGILRELGMHKDQAGAVDQPGADSQARAVDQPGAVEQPGADNQARAVNQPGALDQAVQLSWQVPFTMKCQWLERCKCPGRRS